MAESMSSSLDVESFLLSIEKYPFLYDKRKKEFKDVALKEGYWTAIGSSFQMTAAECIKKFKNLKDRYVKNKGLINKTKRSGASTKDVYRCNWKYFDQLNNMLRMGCRNEEMNSSSTNIPELIEAEPEEIQFLEKSTEDCVTPNNSQPSASDKNQSLPELIDESILPHSHRNFTNANQRKGKRSEEDLMEIIKETSNNFSKYLDNSNKMKFIILLTRFEASEIGEKKNANFYELNRKYFICRRDDRIN